jgi:hypothetical protein
VGLRDGMISAMSRRHGLKDNLGIFEWDSLGSDILEGTPLKFSIVSPYMAQCSRQSEQGCRKMQPRSKQG